MSMSQQDLELCRGLVKVLRSEKNSKFNALFMNPFDLSHTPGYLDICGRVMDLSTLSHNLENSRYFKRREVYDDCNLTFENAIKYHSDKDTTKWIVSPAKNMLKIAKREQQKIEKKVTGVPKIKLKLGGSGGDARPKIRIKQPAARVTGATISRGKIPPVVATSRGKTPVVATLRGKTPPPGVGVGVGVGSLSTAGSKDTSASPSSQPPPKKKPRLTLKLGKSKTQLISSSTKKYSETTSSAKISSKKSTTVSSSSTASSLSSTKKLTIRTGTDKSGGVPTKKNSIKTGSGGGPSRGKELPKGVIAPAKPKTDTKKVTKSSKATGSSKKASIKLPAVTASKSTASKVTKVATPKSTTKSIAPKSIAQKSTSSKTSSSNMTSSKTTKTTTKTSGTKKEKNISKAKITLTASIAAVLPMTPARKAQFSKILNGIKRRKAKSIIWFEKPVSDKKIIQDYKAKIKYPMDLSTMQSKLDNTTFGGSSNNKGYTTDAEFVLDLRRIFGNCLRFNTSNGKDSLRPIAVETLEKVEQISNFFLAKSEFTNKPAANVTPLYPSLLFCWKLCVNVIDTLYNLTNQEDKHHTAFYFMHPVTYYFGGALPTDYLNKAPRPMDFGTVTSQLMEGQYTSLDQFESDCELVLSNCMAYYGGKAESKVFCDQAARLNQVLQQQLDALNRYVKSSAGLAAQKSARLGISTSTLLPKPPIPLLLTILAELRDQKYTDKMTKITEPAMAIFEKPVSVAVIPDYMQYVHTPMDLQTVERKIKNVQYGTPEDFEYDMILMFQNCIKYNGARKVEHLVGLGRFGLKSFRRIFSARMKAFDDPSSGSKQTPPLGMSSTGTSSIRKNPPIDISEQGPSKKMKIDTSGVSRGKAAPRISLSAATLSEAHKAATAAAQSEERKANKLTISSSPKVKSNQPVPLHIAIAQVKERFPLRRDIKSLQSWEAACARFFKELKRHPWISAARPKFIFHVPVPVLFPELKEAYGAKIKKPMDLTTAECTLLAGNRYTSPEDFVNDVALVFANAISFNKDGRDVGDPLSCAYHDASIHLLKYTRWLSLDLLSDYVVDSDHVDEPEEEGMPVKPWKFTQGNVKKGRSEMEAIVLNEPLEKTLEGDRYSWMESECEKLLKSLRHQSDFRYMTFFLTPNYPPDYSAFITRPMDWEKVQKTLKKRNYDTCGAVIDDLRLIFTNALKYNARLAGTDSVSGRAYDSAKIMSSKLETAINKFMTTVSDRVERERIDHNNADREIEAAERVEEARIRAQWKSESTEGGNNDGSAPSKVEGSFPIRLSIRLSTRRKSDTDFEVPFFEEEYDGQHEQSYVEVMKQQKVTFGRQRSELVTMRRSTMGIGNSVFNRMMQEKLALEWIADEQKKLGITLINVGGDSSSNASERAKKKTNITVKSIPSASSISAKRRNPLKIYFPKNKRKKNVKRTQDLMDWDDESDD